MHRNNLLYLQARKLRKSGKSYSDINQILNISKSTLSDWFSNLTWSRSVRNQLVSENKNRSSNFWVNFNRLKRHETLNRYEDYRKEARNEYITLIKNPLFLAGISIYWGEGEKTENGRVGLVNSDDRMIQTITNFYRSALKIPEEKLRGAVFVYRDNKKSQCVKYWVNKTQIPEKQFIKTQTLPSRSKHTKRKVKNGLCNVYFTDVKMNIKLKEWINLLAIETRA